MVKLVDTHAHIFVKEFEDLQTIIKSAVESGVEKILMPNIDLLSIEDVVWIKRDFPKQTEMMLGLHPCSVDENYIEVLNKIKKELVNYACCGVGEIGLDYYWSKDFINEQQKALEIQLQWAIDTNLPVSLHTRNATKETIDICKNFKGLKGVFHCFGGTEEEAKEIINLGMYLGIGGVLTFKNSGLDKVLEGIDLEHIVLETDSPYLAPLPFRGKRNEPAYLLYIAEKLAVIKNVTLSEVAEITTKNANKIFDLR